MPNWCNNKLNVRGPELDVRAFRQMAIGYSPWPRQREGEREENLLNFHNLVPIPTEVLAAGYDGAGTEWERQNWGCAYGAFETVIQDEWDNMVVYEFLTAWLPPTKFVSAVAMQYPSLILMLDYDEPGAGFKGIARFQNAREENHCLSY